MRWRIVLVLAFSLLPLHGVHADSGPGSSGSGGDFVRGEVVVKLTRAEDLPAVATAFRLDSAPIARFGAQPIFRLRLTDGGDVVKRVESLARDRRVQFAEPNYVGQAPRRRQDASWASGLSVETYASAQWAATTLELADAHRVSRGAGVVVAILDTGVDPAHPALTGRLVTGYDFVDLDADPTEQPSDAGAYGHGTHVAGLVAATAPEATLMPLRILDANGVGNVWVLAEAVRYALDNGADVVNLSLSTPRRTRLLREVADLERAVLVASAGNSASDRPEYPAAENVDGLLAVGASTAQERLAGFSNRGSWVHVVAPGESVASSVPGSAFAAWSGTSMATAFVTGQAALILSAHPRLSPRDVAERIEDTATRIQADVSRGRINVPASLAD